MFSDDVLRRFTTYRVQHPGCSAGEAARAANPGTHYGSFGSARLAGFRMRRQSERHRKHWEWATEARESPAVDAEPVRSPLAEPQPKASAMTPIENPREVARREDAMAEHLARRAQPMSAEDLRRKRLGEHLAVPIEQVPALPTAPRPWGIWLSEFRGDHRHMPSQREVDAATGFKPPKLRLILSSNNQWVLAKPGQTHGDV